MHFNILFTALLLIKSVVSRHCQCRAKEERNVELNVEPYVESNVELEPEFQNTFKRLTILNSCSFDVNIGVTGSDKGDSKDGVCPKFQTNNGDGRCFFTLDAPDTLKPGQDWSVDMSSEDDHVFSGNVWGLKEPMDTACTDGFCHPWVGPRGSITKAEFTFSKDNTDFIDISIIEGPNLPLEMYPNDVEAEDRYTCSVAGTGSWEFQPGPDLEKFVTVVKNTEGECELAQDCGDGKACGVSFESSPPMHGLCGEFIGYTSAHTLCNSGYIGAPFFCEKNHDIISCMGEYTLSGYTPGAVSPVCGCPDWVSLGIEEAVPVAPCVTNDKDWEEKSLPWLTYLKVGCPLCYEFAYSDMTSTVTCDKSRSYTIEFCPDDTEKSFFGV